MTVAASLAISQFIRMSVVFIRMSVMMSLSLRVSSFNVALLMMSVVMSSVNWQ